VLDLRLSRSWTGAAAAQGVRRFAERCAILEVGGLNAQATRDVKPAKRGNCRALSASRTLTRGESRLSGRNRTIVNTVSLLWLLPVGSLWRRQYWQRIARANIGKVIPRPRNVDHDHLHARLLIAQTS